MTNVYTPCSNSVHGSTSALDPSRCKAGVWGAGSWTQRSQCSRKAGEDGWCKTHHPDAERLRQEAAAAKYEARVRGVALGWHGERFMAALVAIRDGDNDPRETARKALEGCTYVDKHEGKAT